MSGKLNGSQSHFLMAVRSPPLFSVRLPTLPLARRPKTFVRFVSSSLILLTLLSCASWQLMSEDAFFHRFLGCCKMCKLILST